jgi:hypothetical protein
MRHRKWGETLQMLHQDICRLVAFCYLGETSQLFGIVARDALLDSLNDPELRVRVLERKPKAIEHAYSIAARYESFRTSSMPSPVKEVEQQHDVRAVNMQQGWESWLAGENGGNCVRPAAEDGGDDAAITE